MRICGVCQFNEKENLINIKDHTHTVTACESCKQLYHTECIKEWMKVGNTCPQCRKTGTFGALSNRVIPPLTREQFGVAIDIGSKAFFTSLNCSQLAYDVKKFGSALELAEIKPRLVELETRFKEIKGRSYNVTNTADLDDVITKFIEANAEFAEIKPRLASMWSRHFTTPHPSLS
ncbi:hypothetical protein AGMMS49936_07740 [Endomicrobiia bacterium]|nr:hypothetical protein AGMMS49936_07740 [Endomicrobiia bacterium]